jgi:hypothetical protein
MSKVSALPRFFGRLLLLPLRMVWGLFYVFAHLTDVLHEALTSAKRQLREQRRKMEERPALFDQAFVEQAGIQPADVRVALATRQALARACGLPATALYPDDALSTLECLWHMRADCPWPWNGWWPDTVLGNLMQILDVDISWDEMEEMDRRARKAVWNGEQLNLQQLARIHAAVIRPYSAPWPDVR